ncbi:MAG: TIGR03617 family F420-dependent LLM class oxidoreductase [Alphaproteobacteria bacterium]|nr:TIGR03617 family F420-dependent LLM class oxidoreductase [Alphaproteobacteria bacterium]
MLVDATLDAPLARIPEIVPRLEAIGFDGVRTTETRHDPFLPLLLAAEHSRRLTLTTSIAVAFARSPMTVAQTAHDLNALARGRFILGLGSQVKGHVIRRFSMPFDHPAARMAEFVQALRAIWAAWYQGKALDFRGAFYTHTLMTPAFQPEDTTFGAPKVAVAAVGPLMTEVAGRVADGAIAHPFTTARYLGEVTVPIIAKALAARGRARADFELAYPPFIASGATEEALAEAVGKARQNVAFYASTPAYRGVLALHGWEAAQDELNKLARAGRWDQMAGLIDDGMLNAFAVVAEPDRVAGTLRARYGGLVDRIVCGFDFLDDPARPRAVAELKAR